MLRPRVSAVGIASDHLAGEDQCFRLYGVGVCRQASFDGHCERRSDLDDPKPLASLSNSRASSTSVVARFGIWLKLHLRRFGFGLVGRPSLTRCLVGVRSTSSALSMTVETVRRLSVIDSAIQRIERPSL